ncbi:MAG: tetratricopeptide repeat protein [Calditrichaeota bacterium]|nr:MAG: tetratricopeptide repeat protein [Calditrichota bacterium]
MTMHKVTVYILGILFVSQFMIAESTQALLKKGVTAYKNQQWEEALNAFQQALKEEPDNPLINFNAGNAFYKLGKYEEALQAFQKALNTREISLQEMAYYNMGNTLYQLQKYAEAIDAYKKALDLNPEDTEAKYNLELVRAKLKEQSDKQKQQPPPPQKKIEPSEFAGQLKEEAEKLILQHRYKDAYYLMIQGMNSDSTVAAYQGFISRLKDVVEIEEGEGA